uniref:RNA-directed DNA polymerase, eukaryota n=1 Tax=Tanacetum cinerariifolium TaxID=118510 RepID=A0A6L2LYT7_TANCI|nr:RNA-directed DNA polymerase, eukaryota [Tanacetum cinerariifolium]
MEKIAASFYVTNFPDSLDARGLWKACAPYGRIVDSYIARKPSKVGKPVARFQRSHTQKGVQKQDSEHKKVNRKVGTSQPNFPNSRVNHLPRSYASMTHGDVSSTNRQSVKKKTVKLNDPELISVEDTTKTVLVKVKELASMINMHCICSSEGFSNVKAHHVGGLWTWLEFQTSDACLAFKTNDNLKRMFASIFPVRSNFVIDERAIWIDINGLPLCAWGSAALKKVANLFGRFMFFEYNHAQNISIGRVCIATKYKKFIDEEVSVQINGEPFTVYVHELSNWSTKIEEENEKGIDEMIKKSYEDCTNDGVGHAVFLHDKLEFIKNRIKSWHAENNIVDVSCKRDLTSKLGDLELEIDSTGASEEEKEERIKILHQLNDIDRFESLDLAQKARLKWTSILINGSPTSEFSLKRGLSHGDLLSPFLFILIMEGLHIALKDAFHNNLIRKVQVSNPSIRVSYFFYTNDVVLVTEWNQVQMDNILCILNVFFLASGLRININIPNVYGIGVSNDKVEDMDRLTVCRPGSLPFTYLGLPIGSNMSRLTHWQGFVDKFKSRLSKWKFFWGGEPDSKLLILIKWENVIASLEKGGLVIGSLKAFNLAFLQKWRWRLVVNPNSLWAQVIKAIHGEKA